LIAVDVPDQGLKAFLDALAHDAALQKHLNDTKDLDAALAVAREAGFDVSKADWLRHQVEQSCVAPVSWTGR
jgi:predicted ribosomally synthesized peptide with nif11-like leader